MKRYIEFIGALALAYIMMACSPMERYQIDPIQNRDKRDWSAVNASAVIGSQDNAEDTPYTKAMVNIYSAQSIEANFLKIDEDVVFSGAGDPQGAYTFHSNQLALGDSTIYYPSAYLVNGSITSAADNTEYHLRDVLFRPDQSYRVRLKYDNSGDTPKVDTLFFHHTRMIGWSPRTKSVPALGASMLSAYQSEGIYEYKDGKTSIVMTDIDLSQDVMFTDLREAQHWHHNGNTEDKYRVPFGYNTGSPVYSNFFTFKHYRSAVRIFAQAEQSQQNLSMWGQLTKVELSKQPTKCVVELPDNVHSFPSKVTWSEPKDQSILTDGMFGDDPNYAQYNLTAEYPVSMTGATQTNLVYLGWAMVEPEKDIVINLHTTSGVYQVTIPHTSTEHPEGLFKASQFYSVKLNLQTSGAIAEILEFQSDEHYFDLTKLSSMDEKDDDDPESQILGYRYSNCYIVDTQSDEVSKGLVALNEKLHLTGDAKIGHYDGYAFSAIHIGNGDAGIIPTKNANPYFDNSGNPTSTIDPASARLVWESSKGLITNVELIHTYVRFKIHSDANKTDSNRLKGNAVIAVYDKDENLLWSWHIWVTDTPDSQTIGGATFMDRNLGATAAMTSSTAAGNALDTYGLYYQWGRKDPSMGPPSYNYSVACLNTATYYDYASDPQSASMIKTEASPTIMTGIKNPMYLVLPSVNRDNNWLADTYTDLWGYDGTRTNKSIYDPCPYGYRVPGEELVAATASGGSNQTYGYKVDNLYLPYAGFKGDDKGSITSNLAWAVASQGTGNGLTANIRSVGVMGDYQSSILDEASGSQQYNRRRLFVNNYTNGFQFWIGSQQNKYTSRRIVDYTNRRNASSVRCVKDEVMGTLTADLIVSVTDGGSLLLRPNTELSLDYNALSSGSALTSVTLDVQFDVESQALGGGTTTETATQRLYSMSTASPKVSDDGTIKFTVQDADFLSKVTSPYRFILTAKNDAGKTVEVIREVGKKFPTHISIETNSPYTGNNQTVAKFGTVTVTATADRTGTISFNYNTEDFDKVSGPTPTASGKSSSIDLRAKKDNVDASTITATVAETAEHMASTASANMKLIPITLSLDKTFLVVRGTGTAKLTATTNTDPAYVGFSSSNTNLLTVDKSGNIAGTNKDQGDVTVTASINGAADIKATCQVRVLRAQYWKKASSVDEIKGKTVVLVAGDYIAKNEGLTMQNAEFDPMQQSYTDNTFSINTNATTITSTKVTDVRFRVNRTGTNRWNYAYSLQLNNTNSNNTWTITYNNGFTIQSKYNDTYYLRADNGSLTISGNNNATQFEIWYAVESTSNGVYTIMQNSSGQSKYMYDSNVNNSADGLLAFSANGASPSLEHYWLLVQSDGKTYAQNVATGRYVADEGDEGEDVTTKADFSSASALVIEGGNKIKIGNLYIVSWGTRQSQTIGLWRSGDDTYTITRIQD